MPMLKKLTTITATLFVVLIPLLSRAQDEPTATTTENAPVFASANNRQEPVRIARQGSVLLLLEEQGDWCRVEYQDPELGRRTGYVERKSVRIDRPTATQASTPARPPQRAPVSAQSPATGDTTKSVSSGFFLGVGLEGNGLVANSDGINSSTDSGGGGGIVIGYGFNPRWSLYGALSGASMSASDFSGSYGLGHFDLGTRIHFRTGPNTVVPFVQAGISGRAASQSYVIGLRQYDVTAGGAGVEFGGGLNAHFTPRFAFSGGVTWMVGNFSTYKINDVSYTGPSVSETSARVHLGMIWFLTGSQKTGIRSASERSGYER